MDDAQGLGWIGTLLDYFERVFLWIEDETLRGWVTAGAAIVVLVILVFILGGLALALVRRANSKPNPEPATLQPEPEPLPAPPPSSTEPPHTLTPPKDEAEIEARVAAGLIGVREAEWLLERIAPRARTDYTSAALLSAESGETPQGEPAAPPSAETGETFIKAAVEIGQEGDAVEKEALALLAEGKTAEAAARYESDIQQAAGQAIEKLRRMGALFAPADTHVAKDAYERLLALAPEDLAARNELGHLQLRLGDLDDAEASYQTVLDRAHGRRETEAAALGNLGLIAQTRGDLNAAEAFHKQSLEIEKDLGRKEGMASDLGNLGIIALTRGDLDDAEAFFKQSLEINEALGRKEGMAISLHNLGDVREKQGRLSDASDLQNRALKLFVEIGQRQGIAHCERSLGRVPRLEGNREVSRQQLSEALNVFEEIGMEVEAAETSQLLADLDAEETGS